MFQNGLVDTIKGMFKEMIFLDHGTLLNHNNHVQSIISNMIQDWIREVN
jgi:hypothetical protein